MTALTEQDVRRIVREEIALAGKHGVELNHGTSLRDAVGAHTPPFTETVVTSADFSALGRKLGQKVAEYESVLCGDLNKGLDHDVVVAEQVRLSSGQSSGRVLRFPLLALSANELDDASELGNGVVDGGRLVLEIHCSPLFGAPSVEEPCS